MHVPSSSTSFSIVERLTRYIAIDRLVKFCDPPPVRAQRILVPLDGSRLAEAILPVAASFAEKLGGSIVLFHVLEQGSPEEVHGEPHLTRGDEAGAYLEARAAALRARGIGVEVDVHDRPVANVAAAIDTHAHELDADVIAMCAHGHTNPFDRLLGSIAERILRGGSTPILLRTVRQPSDRPFELRTVVVPVDFEHDTETALAAVRAIAAAYGVGVTLVSVQEPGSRATAKMLPGASALAARFALDDRRRRLEELAAELRASVVDVDTDVSDRRPSTVILDAVSAQPESLVDLVTDAHGGLSGWYDPSTTQRLLARPELTLLLIKEL
jgi:nucleotide-binding universal stress UspA family protein